MSISRPLSKELLKKMFLKVLNEHKQGELRQHSSSNFHSIIRYELAGSLGLERFSDEESMDAYRAVYELERDGYIMQELDQSSSFKILTKRGEDIVAKEVNDMVISTIDIDPLIENQDLIRKIHDDFIERDYETAIFKAFRQLEESVRIKAKLGANTLGAELMSQAFRPKDGILNYSLAKTESEKEAFHLLMRSAIMMFKNPTSHRTVGYDNEQEAAHVIGLADLLLSMLNKCDKK